MTAGPSDTAVTAALAAYTILEQPSTGARPFVRRVLTASLAHAGFAERAPLLRGLRQRLDGCCDPALAGALISAVDIVLRVPRDARGDARDILIRRL